MIIAYKQHFQFIMILAIMYVSGVWGGPIIYPMFPIFMLLFGIRKRYFELLITSLWLLMLSDYVPVKDATYDDLQFAKDLKALVPLILFLFYLRDWRSFAPIPRIFLYFIPFFLVVIYSLNYSLKIDVGIQKTISYLLMYFTIPVYVAKLHRDEGEYFWTAFLTFIIGMLTIGVVLGFAAPQIGLMSDGRFKGVLGNPNGLGIFLYLTFILWVIIEEFKLAVFTRKERVYIIFILLFSLFWCGTRNGMMSILLFYIVYRAVKINWFVGIIFILTFISLEEVFFDFFLNTIEFFNLQDYFRVDTIEEGSGRKIAWMFAYGEIVQHNFFIGGGFGHDENVMRPNYYWLEKLGHNGGVHNSYLSMWFDSGIIGVVLYFISFIGIVFSRMKFSYVVIAFATSIFFNVSYESWMVASLNPFTLLFLTILTIFESKLRDCVKEVQPVEQNNMAMA
ncbi:MAG: O-antigen ligase family protein [Crocinitomicaceae bacterium]|nr:O-antigen ligase family protein [Crocinitomicaceae bacterium]